MDAFEIVALVGAVAGFSMVVGGIWLVAKGVITLAATPKAEALTIEWKKQFRLNTQVPGLAFFLVGLMFIAVSLTFLKPSDVAPISFEGQIRGIDQQVSIFVRPQPWVLAGDSVTGQIRGTVYPDVSVLVLSVTAPGYEPLDRPIKINLQGRRVADLGVVELRQSGVRRSDLSENIVPLPFSPPDASMKRAASFGVSQ